MKTTKLQRGHYKIEANGKVYELYNWGTYWSLTFDGGREEICETKKEAMFIIKGDK